ncbi:MAG: TGS domain-containing protein [Deltaproteobacteria bacterium]|nr:TGS domain-containing protein [Deltaproteobacteria bacterium]
MIFGNAGQIVTLPENATVRDFVERFNPEISSPFFMKVNGEIASMDRTLRDGDTVEVIEGNEKSGPRFASPDNMERMGGK